MHCHRPEAIADRLAGSARAARRGSAWIGTLALFSCVAQCSSEPTRVPVPTPVVIPYGWLDAPVAGKVHGKTRAQGWALSDQGRVGTIEILCDGVPMDVWITRFPTPGFCTKFPGRTECATAGFAGFVDFSLLAKGAHTLSLRLTDSAASRAEIGKRSIVVE